MRDGGGLFYSLNPPPWQRRIPTPSHATACQGGLSYLLSLTTNDNDGACPTLSLLAANRGGGFPSPPFVILDASFVWWQCPSHPPSLSMAGKKYVINSFFHFISFKICYLLVWPHNDKDCPRHHQLRVDNDDDAAPPSRMRLRVRVGMFIHFCHVTATGGGLFFHLFIIVVSL